MGLRLRGRPVEGVQFHPESILTPEGKHLLANFLQTANPGGSRDRTGRSSGCCASKDLSVEEARGMMDAIMTGAVPEPQIAALLTALRMKGETVAEITGFAAAMRGQAIAVTPRRDGLVDTCGTGGDAGGTFNISTAAALRRRGDGDPGRQARQPRRLLAAAAAPTSGRRSGVNIELTPRGGRAS